MTTMKRMTISMPDELAKKIIELRKRDEFCQCSYSEIIRRLVESGLQSNQIVDCAKI